MLWNAKIYITKEKRSLDSTLIALGKNRSYIRNTFNCNTATASCINKLPLESTLPNNEQHRNRVIKELIVKGRNSYAPPPPPLHNTY